MAKLNKREKEKIVLEYATEHRGDTWVGIRPAIFRDRKRDKKMRRTEGHRICAAYC